MGPRPMPASTCKKKLLPLLLTQLCIRTLQPPAVCSSCYCHTWPWEQPQQCSLHQTTSGGCAAVAAAACCCCGCCCLYLARQFVHFLGVAAAAASSTSESTMRVLLGISLQGMPSERPTLRTQVLKAV